MAGMEVTLRGIAATGSSGRSRANRLKLAALVACLLLFVFAGKLYAGSSWRGGFRGQGGSLASSRRDSDAASGSNTKTRDKTNDKSYVLVIDCGSSGTRMNAFEFDVVAATTGGMPREAGPRVAVPTWIPSAAAPEELIPKRSTETRRAYQRVETEPGLSTYLREQRLHEIGDKALRPLLAWAEAVVPNSHWADTPVYLLATAGLRRLSVGEQEQVLGACREVLAAAPFRFENSHARVIDGREEGMFGWAALNAAEGKLGVVGREADTIGALDLGGSSLEVTYVDSNTNRSGGSAPPSWQEVRVGGVTYRVQTTSYVGAGLDDAFERMLSSELNGNGHPCLNRGYDGGEGGRNYNNNGDSPATLPGVEITDDLNDKIGGRKRIEGAAFAGGSNAACYELADAVVGSLAISDSHSTTDTFAAMSGFYVINHFFGLDSSATLADVQQATDSYCALPWDDVLQRHRDELSVHTYCFRGAYVAALLKELGVRDVILGYDDGRVGGWPMGFAVLEMDGRLGTRRGHREGKSALWMVVVLAGIVLAAAAVLEKLGKRHSRNALPRRRSTSSGSSGNMGSSRSLEGMEEGARMKAGSFTRSSTVSRKLNEIF